MRKYLISAAALAAATVAAPSNAAVTFGFFGGLNTSGLSVIEDFSDASGIVSGSNYVIHPGSPNDATGAAPYYGDGSSYLSVLSGGSATINLPATSFLAFDVGSLDTYNDLEILYTTLDGGTGSFVYSPTPPADGNQTQAATNGLFTLTGDAGEVFTSITFKSGGLAFEVDNLAVPEASTWAMMLVGLGAVGFAMRRQKVSVSFA